MSGPRILVIAGPNGAGKTTFAREFLPSEARCPIFINADLIAAGLSPFLPERVAIKAGRLMLQEMDERAAQRENFAFETTLSGRGYVQRLQQWQSMGYRITLYFLRLESPELAVARVAKRVQQGGHHIPEEIIRRRFRTGLKYFEDLYKPIADDWMLFNNSGESPELMEWSERK